MVSVGLRQRLSGDSHRLQEQPRLVGKPRYAPSQDVIERNRDFPGRPLSAPSRRLRKLADEVGIAGGLSRDASGIGSAFRSEQPDDELAGFGAIERLQMNLPCRNAGCALQQGLQARASGCILGPVGANWATAG